MSEKEIVKKFTKAQDSLVVQQSDFSLETIAHMVKSESIDISPHYQRRDRWKDSKQSALIESFLLNVPVPPVYLSEDDYGKYSVIDGKQRITAIYEFLTGKLKLKDLKEFPDLNGSTFIDIPSQLRNVLTVRPFIRVITLLKQSDPELKYEVFLRLNTGGEKLGRQEIRNVAYSGSLNDLLLELSENEILKQKLKITSKKSNSYRKMDDVEHVLRFFTINKNWKNMGTVLGDEMDRFMILQRDVDINNLRETFTKSIDRCVNLWGNYAFFKPVNDNDWRTQLISPLFDAQMVSVAMLTENQFQHISSKSIQILDETRKLFEDHPDFVKSVSQSTNNPASVRKRISTMHNMLLKFLG